MIDLSTRHAPPTKESTMNTVQHTGELLPILLTIPTTVVALYFGITGYRMTFNGGK